MIDPKYVKYFSNILMDIKQIMEGIDSVNNEEIPDKEVVIKRLETKSKENQTMIFRVLVCSSRVA